MPADRSVEHDRPVDELDELRRAWTRSCDAVTNAAAVVVATRSGVLAALAAEHDPAGIARATGCDRRGVELVLDVLVDTGVVVHGREGYRLASGGPSADEIASRMDAVEHLARTGRPVMRVDEPTGAGRAYPGVVVRLGRLVEDVARELAENQCAGRATPPRVLDVAAGAAPFAIAFARAGATVTALDLPDVAPTTEASIAAAGIDGVRVLGGDLFEVAIDDRFDIVVLAGFCRLVGPERAATAIARCASWLAAGGTLVVVDAVDTLDTRRRGLARYALDLATRTATGRPHGYPSYGAWFAAAGLVGLDLTTTDRPEISLISARLPEGAGA